MTQPAQTSSSPDHALRHRWAVILAEEDRTPQGWKSSRGERRKRSGILEESPSDQTLRSVERIVRPSRMLAVVTKRREHFYKTGNVSLVVQPKDQGTGPAIVYSLMRLYVADPKAVVAFFPSDHRFADQQALSGCAADAFQAAESNPNRVILLGIEPGSSEAASGWIEAGGPLATGPRDSFFEVRRFWERPSRAAAVEFMRQGYLWNSCVMAGRVGSFLSLVAEGAPHLFRSFRAVAPALFTKDEKASIGELYERIPFTSFSADVLETCPDRLAVLRSSTLRWEHAGKLDRDLAAGSQRHGNRLTLV